MDKENYYDFLFQDFFAAFQDQSLPTDISYLQKSDRILTLARERYTNYRRNARLDELTDADSKIFCSEYNPHQSYYDVMHHISRVYTRAKLKSITEGNDTPSKELIDLVTGVGFDISLEIVNPDDRLLSCLVYCAPSGTDVRNETVLKVTFSDSDGDVIYYGLKNVAMKHRDKVWRYGENYYRIVDLGDFFSSLIIYSYVMKEVIRYRRTFEVTDVITEMTEIIFEKTKQFLRNTPANFKLSLTDIWQLSDVQLIFPKAPNEALSEWLSLNHVSFKVIPVPGFKKFFTDCANDIPTVGISDVRTFCSCFIMHADNVFSYRYMLTNNKFRWGLPIGYRRYNSSKIMDSLTMELFKECFFAIAKQRNGCCKEAVYLNNLEKHKARSFETKKNISSRLLKAMESSRFNRYFGFVEFDDETDTDRAEELAKEFESLKLTYCKSVDSSGDSLRFRKIGQHHALGLYYPFVRCLCVDIRSPKSFVHEYGHLIDYTCGMNGYLSGHKDFVPIRDLYVAHITKTLKGEHRKSKYDFNYYAQPTEVFARCFELYIGLCLGVKCSLVPDSFDVKYYPQDGVFLDKIAKYFDNLLGNNKAVGAA